MNIYKLCDEFYKRAIDLSKRVLGKYIVYNIMDENITINLYNELHEIKATVIIEVKEVPIEGRYIKVSEIGALASNNATDALLILAAAWKIGNNPLIPDNNSISSTAARVINTYFEKYKNDPKLVKVILNNPMKSIYYSNDAYTSNLSGIKIVKVDNDRAYEHGKLSEELFQKQYSSPGINKKYDTHRTVNYQTTLTREDIRNEAKKGDSHAISMLDIDNLDDRTIVARFAINGNEAAIRKLSPIYPSFVQIMLDLYDKGDKIMLAYFERFPDILRNLKKKYVIASCNRLLTKYSKD
jgi:hypothetical protein